ncbi:MAG TPA: rod shape-determining protein MreC [Spirochaetia bacterium]|nr:rod shape-determining protein MreC [Spirochaetia bacterium]
MTNSKINSLILPLLFAILLSIASKLTIGNTLDQIFYTILTPVHLPISFFRHNIETQTTFIKSLPRLRQQNKDLTTQNSYLLSENEQLKQLLFDSKVVDTISDFKSILPVRLIGSIGNNSVSSSLPLDKVKIGQPLISGKTLLGTVSAIKGSVIDIIPLDNDRFQTLSVHTSSNQKGQFKHQNNIPQITGISSLSPIAIGDYVFTEPGELIPGNLVIGKIQKIISDQQEPLQKAQIKLESSLKENPSGLVIILEP